MKKIVGIILIAVLFMACGNNENKSKAENGGNGEKTEVIAQLNFDNFKDNAADYMNKEVIIEGSVVHVCTHSGKKMFIVGSDPDTRLKITAGEEIPKFPIELVGSDIIVHGVLKEVTEAAAKPTEGEKADAKPAEGEKADEKSGDDCATDEATAKQSALATLVLEYVSHEVK